MSPTHDGIHVTQMGNKMHIDRGNRPLHIISKGTIKLTNIINMHINCWKLSLICLIMTFGTTLEIV